MRNVISALARPAVLLALMLAGPAWALNAFQMAALISDAQETSSIYGFDAAVDGDTAIVGALGSTHVFKYEQGRWIEQATLAVSGREIELEGGTAVVRGDDATYIYTGSGSTWTRQAVLDVYELSGTEDTEVGNVALDGDTLVIAADHAPDDSQADTRERGKVYVFTRTGTTWSLQSELDIFEAQNLRLGADVDGDTFVVAYSGTVNGVDVYQRTGGSWKYQVTLVPENVSSQSFDSVVAIEDGTVMAKVIEGDSEGVLVYRGAASDWRLHAQLDPQGNQRYAALAGSTQGISDIALDGDVAIIGSAGHSEEGRLSGSAYVFTREGGHWRQQQNLLAPGTGTGIFVSLSGNRAVLGGVDRFGPVAPVLYQLFPGQVPRLFCPGDVDGDGEADLALLTPEGNVSVKSLDRRQLNWFRLHQNGTMADAELVPDTDGNGVPELAALEERSAVAEVRDLASGGTTGRAAFRSPLVPTRTGIPTPLDLETLNDQSGNGIPELALLVEYPYAVLIRDGLGGDPIRDIGLDLPEYRIARDLDPYPHAGGDVEALAVIGDNWAGGVDRVDFRASDTGELLRRLWLGEHGDASSGSRQEQVRIADLNGNGSPEMAILVGHEVQIRDTQTSAVLGQMEFNRRFVPIRLVAIPDNNGNGADELVLMGKRLDGTVQRADIKDSGTGQNLGRLWFDRNFVPIDLIDCGDINGNGAVELAVLGQRGANGLVKTVVKDSRTGAVVSRVWF